MIDFSNINLQNVDLSNESIEGSNVISEGWHKLQLVKISDEKQTSAGTALGAVFTFQALDGSSAGMTFDRWFCTQATDTKMAWSQKAFVNFALRVAQCVGLNKLTSISELVNRPFWSYLTVKERTYDSKEIDVETGLPVKKTSKNNEFKAGSLTEVFLSCQDYNNKYIQPSSANFQFNFNPNQ